MRLRVTELLIRFRSVERRSKVKVVEVEYEESYTGVKEKVSLLSSEVHLYKEGFNRRNGGKGKF